jgi:hypothetical protein
MRCPTRVACLLLTLGSTGGGRLAAQERTTLDSGAVVRLRVRGGEVQRARLLAPYAPDSSAIRFCHYPAPTCGPETLNPPQERPAASLAGVEVRRGNATRHGMVVGALVGAGLGALMFVLAASVDGDGAPSHPELAVPLVSLNGMAWGALIGAFSDNWEPLR